MLRVPGALRALLTNLIDYAGLYPPASLPLEIVAERHRGFLASPENWILNRLVLPVSKLTEVELPTDWRVSLLVESDPGTLPAQVETLESKTTGDFSLPTYFEMPLDRITHGFAKIRTGGLTPDSIPSSLALAEFLSQAAARRLPFKATAGLHHPIRSVRSLSYETAAPCATMHGFLNVFAAAAFAWHGMARGDVVELIEERDASRIGFSDRRLEWNGHAIEVEQIEEARREFAHSFGSCSFEEPVTELRALGLLP